MKKLILISFLFLSCTKEQLDECVPTKTTFKGSELVFFDAVNEMRLNRNLAPLRAEKQLTVGCKQHVVYMFSKDSLSHEYFWNRYTATCATSFGEVVAYGFYTPESILSAYQSSPDHYNVLINPKYTHIGIASKGLYQCVNLAGYGQSKKYELQQEIIINN